MNQLHQLHGQFKERATFFNIVVTHVLSQEGIQKIQDSPPALGEIWLQSLKNSTRVCFSLIS